MNNLQKILAAGVGFVSGYFVGGMVDESTGISESISDKYLSLTPSYCITIYRDTNGERQVRIFNDRKPVPTGQNLHPIFTTEEKVSVTKEYDFDNLRIAYFRETNKVLKEKK